MSRAPDRLRRGLKHAARRTSPAHRGRRPALERLEDLVLPSTLTVVNTNGSGPGSLDQAIRDANAANSSTPTTIVFDIPGTGPKRIVVGSDTGAGLPTIHVPIILDGWSEGVSQGKPGYQGSPLIILDGSGVTQPTEAGLDFAGQNSASNPPTPGSSGSVVQGLDLVRWISIAGQESGGIAIKIEGGSSLAGTSPAANVTIQGNYIGVGPNGSFLEPNDVYGVLVQGNNNTIGGTTVAARNVIAGNGNNVTNGENRAGVAVYPGAVTVLGNTVTGSTPTDNVIQGNYIGVAADGKTRKANELGVLVGIFGTTTVRTTIGGTTSAAGNVISGNSVAGIELFAASATIIQANMIGADSTGLVPVGNNGVGIINISSDHTTIGGPGGLLAPGNLIVGNAQSGIFFREPGSTGALIQGNTIGAPGMANSAAGIAFVNGATGNTVGGTSAGDGNIIQSNAHSGVVVGLNAGDTKTVGNTIEGNAIFGNVGLGIDLSNDGVTLNQTGGSLVAGPNDLQNYPVLTSLTTSGSTTTISGRFDQPAKFNTTLRIEFFGDPGAGGTNGQGQTFLGATQVTTDGNGHAAFTDVPIASVPPGDVVSATAIVVSTAAGGVTVGDTSEFSANLTPPVVVLTAITLQSSENPSPFGDPVTFTATVAAMDGSTPTGNVVFTIDGIAQPAVALSGVPGDGVASWSAISLAGGHHTIGASYEGADGFATSTATTLDQVVSTAATTTTLGATINPSSYGQSVLFTAEVSSAVGGIPTGTVTFTVDGVAQQPSVPLTAGSGLGRAELAVNSLGAGPHTISAAYSGDTNFTPSAVAGPLSQTVNKATTTTTLGSSSNPSTFGQSVTFTATVVPEQGGALTGNVTFSIDGAPQTPVPITNVGGVATATFIADLLGGGPHAISATYNGDSNSDPSTTAPNLTQTVNPAPSTTTLGSSSNPSTSGQAVMFIATIFAVDGPPTGNVVFTIDNTPQPAVPLSIAGGQSVASLTGPALSVGSHTILVRYNGDANFGASPLSTSLTQVVQAAPTTTTLTAVPATVNAGQTVTLTAIVSGATNGVVAFLDGPTVLANVAVDANDQAVLSVSTLAVGTHAFVATYSGAPENLPSQSTAVSVMINALPSTTILSSAPASTTFGQAAIVAVVVAGSPDGPSPTGSVTLFDGSALIGTAPVNNGQANFTIASLGVGAHLITAAYSGDNVHTPSTSAVAGLTVARSDSATLVSSTANPSGPGQLVTFTAVVSGPTGVASPTGTVVFLDGTTPIGTATLSANDVATFSTSTLAAGAHAITASYNGNSNLASSTSTALSQLVTAAAIAVPTVTNLQRFGFHAQPTMLVLSFRGALDPARAQNIANYTVTGGSGALAVTSAVYNQANSTVTLHFRQRLNVHRTFTITVNGAEPGGVTSVDGMLLDGASVGRPGSNYVNTFGMEILAGTSAEAAIASTMRTLEQIDHGHITARAIHELLAQGRIRIVRRHHRGR